MEYLGIAGVAAITVICYVGALIVKATSLDNKWLPVLCGTMGGMLGVVSMHIMPDFPATDIITAIAVGIASGLAATGADQVIKQLSGHYGMENIKTCELSQELEKREGVEKIICDPHEPYTISGEGPAVVLVIID